MAEEQEVVEKVHRVKNEKEHWKTASEYSNGWKDALA